MIAETLVSEADPGPAAGWVRTLDPIADEYAAAIRDGAPVGPAAAESWRALAATCRAEARAIRSGAPVRIVGPDGRITVRSVRVDVVGEAEPYPGPAAMAEDAVVNGIVRISRANSEHPVWSEAENVDFRTVHDIRGHLASGGDFGWVGENRACAAHRDAIARPQWSTRTRRAAAVAMFCECIAQTGYAIARGGFGPQRVAILRRPDAETLPTDGGFYARPEVVR